jgi:hypothetical protein
MVISCICITNMIVQIYLSPYLWYSATPPLLPRTGSRKDRGYALLRRDYALRTPPIEG